MDNQRTGRLIAARRQELGLTQKELADKLNISDRTVSKWERGAGFPDVSLLEPLADALELSVLELIRGERLTPEAAPAPEAEQAARETSRELGGRFRGTLGRLRTALCVLGALFALLLGASLVRYLADPPARQTVLSQSEALALCPFALITQDEYELARQLLDAAAAGPAEDFTVPASLLSIGGEPAVLIQLDPLAENVAVTYADKPLGSRPNRQVILMAAPDGPVYKTCVEYDGEGRLLYWLLNQDNTLFRRAE